jgi:hypothetical protein
LCNLHSTVLGNAQSDLSRISSDVKSGFFHYGTNANKNRFQHEPFSDRPNLKNLFSKGRMNLEGDWKKKHFLFFLTSAEKCTQG